MNGEYCLPGHPRIEDEAVTNDAGRQKRGHNAGTGRFADLIAAAADDDVV